jgi:hypothetical protein
MENLAHIEANLDNELEANADEYDLGAMTDETLDEMAEEMDREEMSDLANAIAAYLRLNDRLDSDTSFEDERQEWEEERTKALLKIQQLMVSVSCDMGLMTPTPDLYQRLYGNKTA